MMQNVGKKERADGRERSVGEGEPGRANGEAIVRGSSRVRKPDRFVWSSTARLSSDGNDGKTK